MAMTEHRGQSGTQRNRSWRQWSKLTTLRKMDHEGLYSSARMVMNDGPVTSLFWNKREPRVCAGRRGLHVESLRRLTDHWTHNEVIPSRRVTPVELIILCLTDTAGMMAWVPWLQFLYQPLDVSVAPVVSLESGLWPEKRERGEKRGGLQLKQGCKEKKSSSRRRRFSNISAGFTTLPGSSQPHPN